MMETLVACGAGAVILACSRVAHAWPEFFWMLVPVVVVCGGIIMLAIRHAGGQGGR